MNPRNTHHGPRGATPATVRWQMDLPFETTRELRTRLHGRTGVGARDGAASLTTQEGMTRWVTRDEFRRFALSVGARPQFLFPEDL